MDIRPSTHHYDQQTPEFASNSYNYLMDLVRLLVDHGADINQPYQPNSEISLHTDSETILHVASRQNNLPLIAYLIENGANVDAPNEYGSNALHNACLRGHYDAARMLIEQGNASVFHRNDDGLLPLDVCGHHTSINLKYYIKTVMIERSIANDYRHVDNKEAILKTFAKPNYPLFGEEVSQNDPSKTKNNAYRP